MRIHFFFLKKNLIRVFKWILKMTILDKLNLRKTFVEYSLNEKSLSLNSLNQRVQHNLAWLLHYTSVSKQHRVQSLQILKSNSMFGKLGPKIWNVEPIVPFKYAFSTF